MRIGLQLLHEHLVSTVQNGFVKQIFALQKFLRLLGVHKLRRRKSGK